MPPSLDNFVARGIAAALVIVSVTSACGPASPPSPDHVSFARMPDGKPNLNGIWAANNTANWNIQTHAAKQGPVAALGAAFSVPGGLGVVEGGEIPYKPEALAQRDANAANWMANDPEVKCYLPGVPRATYMPYPFQIVQSTEPNDILLTYEFASASRIVHMNTHQESPIESLDGVVDRPLGGRHARRRRQGLHRPDVVRPRRQLPQRRAARRRALHAARART